MFIYYCVNVGIKQQRGRYFRGNLDLLFSDQGLLSCFWNSENVEQARDQKTLSTRLKRSLVWV
jgi:hypothetical protein